MKFIYLVLTFILITSCGEDQLNGRNPSSSGSQTVSESCVCTFEYNPVCSAGKTYDNPCIAKCQGVNSFSNGKCSCNVGSGEICATPPMSACAPGMMCAQVMPTPKTYASECEMIEDKAKFIKNGPCN